MYTLLYHNIILCFVALNSRLPGIASNLLFAIFSVAICQEERGFAVADGSTCLYICNNIDM